MRPAVPLLLLPPVLALGACALEPALGPAAAVGAASLVLTGRTPVDHVASLVTGQDCSAVRLERRLPYCAPHPGPPAPPPYCTRSLGGVDCWTAPPLDSAPQRGLADPPR